MNILLTGAFRTTLLSLLLILTACQQTEQTGSATDNSIVEDADGPGSNSGNASTASDADSDRLVTYTEQRENCDHYTANRLALFGDVHVHTNLSFDAASNTIGATPEDAHRYARGEAIDFWPLDDEGNPAGSYKIDRPLDFLAVTDHGEFLGERRLCREPESPVYESDFCRLARSNERQGMIMFGQVITTEEPARIPDVCGEDGSLCLEWAGSPWQQAIDAAENAYDRSSECGFTSFIAYEYTGTPGTSNYHRNVIFRNSDVPERPVSYIEAPYDSALWQGLDSACDSDSGCEYLTIPHNTNLANGRMAPYMRLDPTLENKRAYAAKRQQREPIMEIFQHKGNSECINGLGSVLGAPDELCNMEAVRTIGKEERYGLVVGTGEGTHLQQTSEVTEECPEGEIGANGMLGAGCVDPTDYQRSGLLVGLAEERETGINPVKLGVVAATDTHTASPGSVMENDWRGHVTLEASSKERLEAGLLTSGIDGNPGGLAGVWAMENSRDAIFEAMLRREVFGTSGPRIIPRLFAGWDFSDDICNSADLVDQGYARGVPMGADLSPSTDGNFPVLVATALADSGANATPLDKLQIIKGWVDTEGKMHNKVITVAGGDGESHQSLCAVFRDEEFSPTDSVYYYLRAVEHPVPRWHTYDCKALEGDKPAVCNDGSYPEEVHEMAWTSPIWYQPAAE